MTTTEKGNDLEDKFYQYLVNQKEAKELVYGTYPPELCKIYKKKKYYCEERKSDVQFDVVVELFREGGKEPHIRVVFECKNYSDNIPETEVTDFSDKLSRIFKHGSKGVLVVNTSLQSGAEALVKSRKIGLVKYNDNGFEIVLDRTAEDSFLRKGIFENPKPSKPLKFSAYYEGRFCSSPRDLFRFLSDETLHEDERKPRLKEFSPPYLTLDEIETFARELLETAEYKNGPVDLGKVCKTLNLDCHYIQDRQFDEKGNEILGFVDFHKKNIHVYLHENKHRERFTLGHEIGHFYLGHDKFLRSETLIANDLIKNIIENSFNYDRLEIQANNFASCLLLPKKYFLFKIEELRQKLDIKDKGHGHIYVDDQPCNFTTYDSLLSELSISFGASKEAIEIRLKNLDLLTDNREKWKQDRISPSLRSAASRLP